MNMIYLAMAIGFGYWIGNTKSPTVVFDLDKCPKATVASNSPTITETFKQVQNTTVEPINQSSPTPTPSTKNDEKQVDDQKPSDPDSVKTDFIRDSIHEVTVYLMRFDSTEPVKILFRQDQLEWVEDFRAEVKKNNFNVVNEQSVNQGGFVYYMEIGK